MKGLPLLKHIFEADLCLQKFRSENFREPSSFSLCCSEKTVNERRLVNPQTGAEHLPRRSEKRTWPGSSCRGFLGGSSQVLRKKSQGGEGKGAGTLVQRREVSGQGWPGKVKGGWGWSGTGGRCRTREARRREASV